MRPSVIYTIFHPGYVSDRAIERLLAPLRAAVLTHAPVSLPSGVWFTAHHRAGLHVRIGHGLEALAEMHVWRSPGGPAAELNFAECLRKADYWPIALQLLYLEQSLAWAWMEFPAQSERKEL